MFSDKQEELSEENVVLDSENKQQEESEYLLQRIKDILTNG